MRSITLLALSLLTATAAHAQSLSVSGRVIGPDGAPLPGQTVVLHRVLDSGGATIGEAVAGADGGFSIRAEPGTDPGAVFFLAARYEGELYIGQPFDAAAGSVAGQTVQVGVPGTSAAELLAGGGAPVPAPGRPATSRNWLLLLVPLLGAGAAGLYLLTRRGSLPPHRQALIRIAEIDERLTTAPAAQRDGLAAERDRLVSTLRS